MKIVWTLGVWVLALSLIGCGSEGGAGSAGISISENAGDTGYVQLNVTSSVNPSIAKNAVIDRYTIIMEGDGFPKTEQTISAEAGGVTLAGIPAGANRRVRVLALNAQGKTLREGVVENITIEAGRSVEVSLVLESVPVLLNLSDGDAVSNRRLFFHVLTDPDHKVTVDGMEAQGQANGEAVLRPGLFPAGERHFVIRDLQTDRSSEVTLHLWEGQGIKPAPIFSASSVKSQLGGTLWKTW